MTSKSPALELAVQDLDGVHTALRVGANRIELCGALGVGGLTPSIGIIEQAVEAAALAGADGFVHVLVRPRPGGFVYTAAEVETTIRDIRAARAAGAGGVVIGALTASGLVDKAVTAELLAAAEGMQVTFHRAIDAVESPLQTADVLVGLGLTRVLTSGGAARSIDGIQTLGALKQHVGDRLQIMAGGGVRVEDIGALLAAGVDAVHLSAKVTVADPSPSGPGGGAQSYDKTDGDVAAAAAAAVLAATLEA
ncbi:copper homeostasis protein CutC [Microterricola viridarii]|uniref:PF03932 family protein CutC n=1 Tax=Microterricola viridarii TaxID=412690 RepID=A0A0Y0MI57_9MICO|nr:copper homeostasis protein CutC [Microterricola viridarii]AMB58090.1 copper homeostasis protein CutC [Microterricola viridarii]